MPWNSQGGGGSPWGSGGGSGGSGGGRGQGPWGPGGGPQPPNLEEMLRRGQERLKSVMPGGAGSSRGIILVLLIALAVWLASGFYRVQPDEEGVVLRFGKWVRTTQPGLNYHLPAPIETALTPKVTRVNRVDIGFRSASASSTGSGVQDVPQESLMLTGDENIIDVEFTVFWVINDAGKYLFNIRNPEQTVKAAAESAMREVIGRSSIQSATLPAGGQTAGGAPKPASGMLIKDVLDKGRREVEIETHKLLQRILNEYGAGIKITQVQLQGVDPPSQVVDAFRDVQRAAADKETERNQAESYRNNIIPRARGKAAQIVQNAQAYKAQTVAQAQGDSSRFLAIYHQYRNAPEVTRQRLYIETLQDVLSKNPKIIIDSKAAGSGVVPYLPLPELLKRAGGSHTVGSQGGGSQTSGSQSASGGGTK